MPEGSNVFVNPRMLSITAMSAVLRASNVSFISQAYRDLHQQQLLNLPAFTTAPTAAGVPYKAVDGRVYFIPTAAVARRSRGSRWPAVFIDYRDGATVLQVTFDLLRPNGVPADAEPLPLSTFSVRLISARLEPVVFPEPQVLPAPEWAPTVVQQRFAQTTVDVNRVLAILQEDPHAWFDVSAEVSYCIQPPIPPGDRPPPVIVQPPRVLPPGRFTNPKLIRDHRLRQTTTAVSAATRIDAVLLPGQVRQPAAPAPEAKTGRVTQSSASSTGAFFPPTNRDNKPIYIKVSGAAVDADIDADWIPTPHGAVKETGIPNQLYILPDEYGLVFDTAQGRPAMNVLLVPAADPSDYRVRVRVAIAPDLDARRLDLLREWLRAEPLTIPYAELLVGGHQQVAFQPTGAFRDLGLTFVENAGAGIDARGFELVFDCTMQMYGLVAQMLTAEPCEMRLGEMLFQIRPDGASPTVVTHAVPVWLRLNRPATDPIEARIAEHAEGDGVPREVVVSNLAPVVVRVEARPTLLFMDAQMPAPIDADPAVAQALTLAPNTSVSIAIQPVDAAGDETWGGVAVSFRDVVMELDSTAVLARANELASTTKLKTSVRLWSTPLKNVALLPPALAAVYAIETQLRRGTAEPVTVTLEIEAPEKTAEVVFALPDLLAGLRPDQPTFEYRRRNLTFTGTGEWSEWQTVTGRELHIVPVGL